MLRPAGSAVLVLALALAGCSAPSGGGPEAPAPTYAAEFEGGTEARAWFATGVNHMFEASDEQAKQVIEDLYRLGALEVRVTDGEKLTESSPGQTAATLMAKLPADEAKRKALTDYEANNSEDPDPIQGREYVVIMFD